jgi:hypothetical protein
MSLFSVSFIVDADRGRFGRPRFLGVQPMLELHPEAETAEDRGQEARAIAPPPPRERQQTFHVHRCPVCGKVHQVNAARHGVAYGRQLTCCCACELRAGRW